MKIIKLQGLNAVRIVKEAGERVFISDVESITISIPALAMIITFLVKNGFMSKKILYGILSEVEE